MVLKSTRPYSPTVIDCGSSSSQMCQVLLPVSESGMKTREKVSHFQLRFWSETFELSQLSQIEISEYMQLCRNHSKEYIIRFASSNGEIESREYPRLNSELIH